MVFLQFFFQRVLNFLRKKKKFEGGNPFFFVTKNLGGIGDHTTKVAEQVYFFIKSDYLKVIDPKGTEPIVTGEK
jgi:hypothetical protein